MFGLNYIVTCKRDGVKLHEQRFPNQEKADEAVAFWRENGAQLILTDYREHVTFDSVELNIYETVYASPSRKGGAA